MIMELSANARHRLTASQLTNKLLPLDGRKLNETENERENVF
jgi:hypothetical protein